MLVFAAQPPKEIISSDSGSVKGTGAEVEESDLHGMREQVSVFRGFAPGKEPEP